MAGKVLIAPEYDRELKGSLLFLAGPIQGAPEWQEEAVVYVQKRAPLIHIASPRRRTVYRGEFSQEMYDEQVDWETFYLNKAAKDGCIVFWLAKEAVHDCARAYAQTSRFELGEWKVKHTRCHVHLAVGVEKGFTGEKYIRRRLSQDCPAVMIADSLEATCDAAIELVQKQVRPGLLW